MVVAVGVMTRDPDAPDGEKPFPPPLQSLALALVQVSVVDRGYHNEVGDAERVTVTVEDASLACALACMRSS